nr:hypothetical protein [uncultured Fluviicola sp.]
MKVFFLTLISINLSLSFIFAQEKESFPSNIDTGQVKTDSLITDFLQTQMLPDLKRQHPVKRFFNDFDEFWVGARINYYQGEYGFIGLALPLTWNAMYGWPILHVGVTPGMDINISGSTPIYVPKISIEWQYLIGIFRAGYQYFTDFDSRHENRLFLEAGLTFFSYFDITYLHSFGFDGNPLNQGNSYFNLTLTLPIYKVK